MHDDPFDFFNSNGASIDEGVLGALTVRGDSSLLAFIGGADPATFEPNWNGPCVLSAEKGYGKSHLLKARSSRMRDSKFASTTLFHPDWIEVTGHESKRVLVESMTGINVRVPNWLDGKTSSDAWEKIWQISIIGLLVLKLGVDVEDGMDRFGEAFGIRHETDRPEQPLIRRLLEDLLNSLPGDVREGSDKLMALLREADSQWVPAIRESLKRSGQKLVEIYIDSPDESFKLEDHPVLWTWVQQGLLAATWRLRAQAHQLSGCLRVNCVVRREAFDGRLAIANLQQMLNFVLNIKYTSKQLKAMLDDRIRALPASFFAAPDRLDADPLEALTGITTVSHDDRIGGDGVPVEESLWSSIDRHTRRSPREVIEIGKAVASIEREYPARRTLESIRLTVNTVSCENVNFAITSGIPGWTHLVGNAIAKRINSELLVSAQVNELSVAVKEESGCLDSVELLLRHGFLGYSDRLRNRHRHCYVQRFIEHSRGTSISVDNHFFFVHPAFKEWIRSQVSERWGVSGFECLKGGVVGNDQIFEASEPTFRLLIRGGYPVIFVGSKKLPHNRSIPPTFFLFLFFALCACVANRTTKVTLEQVNDVKTSVLDSHKDSLAKLPWPRFVDETTLRANEKHLAALRGWAKDCKNIAELRPFFRKPKPNAKHDCFMSIEGTASGGQGLSIPGLTLEDIDVDPSIVAALAHHTQARARRSSVNTGEVW